MEDLLIALMLLAGVVLGFLAYRGRVGWGWFAAALGGLLAALGWRRGGKREPYSPPPGAPPAGDVARPILVAVDAAADAELDRIREANEDPDREERLKRLADLNQGGRE